MVTSAPFIYERTVVVGEKALKAIRPERRWLLLASALFLVSAASVVAADAVSVESILQHPHSYQRQMVTLTGTASGVVQNLGRSGYSQICIQDFNLNDGTGTIPVRYLALCETVDEKVVTVHEGNRVVVNATVDVPPENIGITSGEAPRFRAMATQVTKSGN
jgi:hypothetical protein